MQKIYLVLTFDHELSLGGVHGTYEENLFWPTDRVLDVADALRVPITLFTDVLGGIRFRDANVSLFTKRYEAQLQDALKRGHDVQLHLHPQWLRAVIRGSWFSPSQCDTLHHFRDEPPPNDIDGIVAQGVAFLNDICKMVQPHYACIAFRAGGLALALSTDKILSALYRHGIRIDSSIAKGYRFQSNISEVDFSDMPLQGNWTIPLSGPLNRPADKGILEVPIVAAPRTPLGNIPILFKRFVLYRSRRWDPQGVSLHDSRAGWVSKLKRVLSYSTWMLSFDRHYHDASDLLKILAGFIQRHSGDEILFASTLSHPKFMGPYHLKLMRDFIVCAQETYGDRLVFCHYADMLRRIDERYEQEKRAS